MPEFAYQLATIFLTSIAIPSIPILIRSVYRSGNVPVLFKRIDELKESKADKVDFNEVENRLRAIEIKYAEYFGRFEAALSRLEGFERRFEEVIKELKR